MPILATFAKTTTRIVQQAAAILEEEVAAGILAARQVEDRFLDTEELRSTDPTKVLPRFRRDAHEVVDIVIDLIGATAQTAGRLAKRAISIRGGTERTVSEAPASTPTLVTAVPIPSGGSGELSLVVENDGDAATDRFQFHSTDLVNVDGHRIHASQITFEPEAVSVSPHQSERVVVHIAVPPDAPAGEYSGLIQSSRRDGLRAAVTVQVL
jgi:hypothetical protein